jgi:D-alanine-D-alanine ligase
MHSLLVPPDDLKDVPEKEKKRFQTELDVIQQLEKHGHEVLKLGLDYELQPLRQTLKEFKPHVVFNLLEEFQELRQFDTNVVAYLELMQTPYTGCNPRGLIIARDKALSKKILAYHRIPAPKFFAIPRGRKARRPKRLEFPLIVKPLIEEGSVGISQASVVRSDEKLAERVQFVHESIGTDVIVEEFIEGREVYAAVLGNQRTTVYPTWELLYDKKPDGPFVNTASAKWNTEYQDRYGIGHGPANLPDDLERQVHKLSKRIYRRLGLSGYARIDFRLTEDGRLYFLEANPNPDIAKEEEFSSAAEFAKVDYGPLLEKLVRLGMGWRPAQAVNTW